VDAGSANAPSAAAAGLAGGDPDPIVVPHPALALDPVHVAGANPAAATQHEQPAQPDPAPVPTADAAEVDAFVQRAIAQVRDVLPDVQRAYRVGPATADAANAAGPDALVQRAIAQVLEVLHMARSQPDYLQTYEFLLPS
jgi:hypothetical protein